MSLVDGLPYLDKDPEDFKLMVECLNKRDLLCIQRMSQSVFDLFEFLCINDFSRMYLDKLLNTSPVLQDSDIRKLNC